MESFQCNIYCNNTLLFPINSDNNLSYMSLRRQIFISLLGLFKYKYFIDDRVDLADGQQAIQVFESKYTRHDYCQLLVQHHRPHNALGYRADTNAAQLAESPIDRAANAVKIMACLQVSGCELHWVQCMQYLPLLEIRYYGPIPQMRLLEEIWEGYPRHPPAGI